MSRIANYASQQTLNSYIQKVQNRIQATQIEMTSEKRSQTYAQVGNDGQRLVGYEVSVLKLSNYMRNNEIQEVKLNSTNAALTGIEKTVKEFQKTLMAYNLNQPTDEAALRNIQNTAFQSMQSMQSLLNTEVDGSYVFSGNRDNTAPVNLGLTNLAAFQEQFDGLYTKYPTTYDSHLETFDINTDSAGVTNWLTFVQDKDADTATAGTGTITATTAQFSNVSVGSTITLSSSTTASNDNTYEVLAVSADGLTIDVRTTMLTDAANVTAPILTPTLGTALKAADFTDLTFDRAGGTITAALASSLSTLSPGSTFKVTDGGENNGTYQVETNTGTVLKIKEVKLTDGGPEAGRMQATGYYHGDNGTRVHRASNNREFTMDLSAIDPAFEKAIRAMGMLAQGKYDTAGGLNQGENASRISDAANLVKLSLNVNSTTNAQYDASHVSSIDQIFLTMGYQQSIMTTANVDHTRLIGFYEKQVASIENIDQLEVITRLLDDKQALEASYQAMATMRGLSLHKYL